MDSVEIMLKEYETLREESLAAMSNRNSILSFGVAAMGVILTASIATYKAGGHLSELMFVLMVPILGARSDLFGVFCAHVGDSRCWRVRSPRDILVCCLSHIQAAPGKC